MKLKVNSYIYKNPIIDNLTILNISDIHSDIKHMKMILNYLKKNKVDLILIPGDVLDRLNEDNTKFINIFKEIANYSPTYIVLGNHDYFFKKHLIFKNNDMIPIKEITKDSSIKNLISLDNIYVSTATYSKIEFNDKIDIHFVVLPHKYYSRKEDTKISDKFFKEIEDNTVNKNKFNILLTHSPNPLIKKKKIINNKFLNSMNLILCGHNHGGLTPTPIQDKLNNHVGLTGPYNTLFNKAAYGIFKRDDSYLLISNGVTKISKNAFIKKVLNKLNNILIPEIDIISFEKDNNYDLQLDNRNKV